MSQDRMEANDQPKLSTDEYIAPNVQVSLSAATAVLNKVRVIHGSNEGYHDLAGQSVGKVRKSLREAFSLPSDVEAFVNGQAVDDDFVLKNGQNLEFNKESGVKGDDKFKTCRKEAVECVSSLHLAVQNAGGMILSPDTLNKMTLMEFITTIAAQNNIRFVYGGPGKEGH